MRTRHLFLLVPAALILAGCAPSAPVASPEPTTAAPKTCDESLFSENVPVDLTATATPLEKLPFPLDGVQDAGLDVTCTAHLTVDYADPAQTVEFDILLTDTPIADVEDTLDDVTAQQDWVRDEGEPLWRAPDDQNHYVQALEIEEGVLIGTTAAG